MDSVYTAVYSGIPVYEMICRSIAVMRRHSDSWLNATQILKVAGIEKGRRTKILEREVLNGEHNKIQGGYGKYQGTWVPYARGVQLCQQYGVYDFMRPILEHDPTESGTRPDRTPTKAEVRKRLRDSSQQRSSSVHGLPSSVRRDRVPDSASTKRFKPSSSNATSPINSELGGSLFGAPQVFTPHADAVANGSVTSYRNLPYNSSPAVRPGGSSIGRGGYQTHNEEASSATVTDSDVLGNGVRVEQDRMLLMNIFLKEDQSFIPEWLSQVDEADDVVDLSTKVNVNLVIDDQGHTAVHWAAALARTHVLDLLLFHGADARKVNYEGESALVRAVQVTNNYENQTFMELLELLHDTIPLTDKQNRTVLHHISLAAGIDGREKAARYYADCLLQWIAGLADGYQVDGADTNAKQEISSDLQPPSPSRTTAGNQKTTKTSLDSTVASEASSQQTATDMHFATPRQQPKAQAPVSDQNSIPISGIAAARSADFAAFLNLQDTNGDTALNLAARIGDRTMIRLLLNAGASPTIANRVGLRPLDFGADKIAAGDAELDRLGESNGMLEDIVSLSPSNRSATHGPFSSTPLAAPQTPIHTAMRSTGKNLLASLMGSEASYGPPTNSLANLDDSDDVWSPSSAQLRIHESVQTIQQLMTEMESDFSGEMRIKQERLDGIKLQLRKTTIELAKARETIYHLHSKTSQLGEVKARVEYLEETLLRETAAVREAISALPPNSKPRLDLEKLLDTLLNSPENAPEPHMILPLVPSGKVDDELEELEKDPAKMRAAVERLRVANQVYARRDALLRERVEALRKRADVSERERQYRQIIASCCEISVADVDVWIDRLISAVNANTEQDNALPDGGELNSTVAAAAAAVAAASTAKKQQPI